MILGQQITYIIILYHYFTYFYELLACQLLATQTKGQIKSYMYKMIIKLGKRNKMKPPITKLGKAQLELIKLQDFKSENYFHKKKTHS